MNMDPPDFLDIGDYALISDCRSAALVSRMGSIDWLCAPRFDSPSYFGRLLDPKAGSWQIAPSGVLETSRRYIGATMVLETMFRTNSGTLLVTDAMALGPNERGHSLAAHSPGVVLREALCIEGALDIEMSFVPRPEYGLIKPAIVLAKQTIVARGGADVIVLSLPEHLEVSTDSAAVNATFRLRKGERAAFALQHSDSATAVPKRWSQRAISARLRDTIEGWETWSSMHQSYQGPWHRAVHHSGRVLQALTFAPTGAMVAAPTTSLPEKIGGSLNWDYRYTWLRDANLTMQALWVAACPDEAQRFFAWIARAAATNDGEEKLGIMFGIGGEHDLTERELPHLSGYRGSFPVRVGNGAWQQDQLDVYGYVLDGVRRFHDHLEKMEPATKKFLIACANEAASRWNETDSGIWEIRGEKKHYVYSKLMCWTALDAAIDLRTFLGASDDVTERWETERLRIRTVLLERGYDADVGAFVQAFDSKALDASALMMPIVGFLPGNDPRVQSTIDVIERELSDSRGLLYRYRSDDGASAGEGSFLFCTFWLAHALALANEIERARTVFERGIACANDVGLLPEEIESATGDPLGNFPQAFSHVGLINAAFAIATASEASG
jgi:GH15 family glucan-1,4-alpha-glucosidase